MEVTTQFTIKTYKNTIDKPLIKNTNFISLYANVIINNITFVFLAQNSFYNLSNS